MMHEITKLPDTASIHKVCFVSDRHWNNRKMNYQVKFSDKILEVDDTLMYLFVFDPFCILLASNGERTIAINDEKDAIILLPNSSKEFIEKRISEHANKIWQSLGL